MFICACHIFYFARMLLGCGIKTLKESKIRDKYKLNVIALENDDETTTIADPNHIFKEEDYVVVLGSDENIRAFEQEYLNE